MDSVAEKLKEAFQGFLKGNWGWFARKFTEVVYCLEMHMQLTEGTRKCLVQTLHLSDTSLHLEENPDGTHTLYSDKKIIDTYDVSEVLAWIWRQFLSDDLLCEEGEIVDVSKIVAKLAKIHFVHGWDTIYEKMKKDNKKHYVINGNVYYFKTTSENKTALVKQDSMLDFLLEKPDVKVVLRDVEPVIFYAKDAGQICCKLSRDHSYVCYNVVLEEVIHVQKGSLIGVNADGVEWYWNEKMVLCSYFYGVIREYDVDSSKYCVRVGRKGVKLLPYLNKEPVLPAYRLECGGVKTYSQEDHNEYKWTKMMLMIMEDLEFGKGDFEHQVNREKFFRKPFPFTWKEIEKHVREQQSIAPWNMEKMRCIFEGK